MALFLLVLLAGGAWLRVTGGYSPPRVTTSWDSKRSRQVTRGEFQVFLYKRSPRLWRAWAISLDVVAAVALLAGIVACLRLAARH